MEEIKVDIEAKQDVQQVQNVAPAPIVGPVSPALQPNVYAKIPALLKATKLTISDISHLTGITRPTLYNWVSQKTAPKGKKKIRLDTVLKQVHNALKAGHLPFSTKPMHKHRKQALIDLLSENGADSSL